MYKPATIFFAVGNKAESVRDHTQNLTRGNDLYNVRRAGFALLFDAVWKVSLTLPFRFRKIKRYKPSKR